jgi:hypothetical protein
MVVVAMVSGGFLYMRRPQQPVADYLPPYDAWVLWQHYREGPVGRLPWEREYETARDQHQRWEMAACVLLAIGALTMVSALMVPKDRPVPRQSKTKQGLERVGKQTDEE